MWNYELFPHAYQTADAVVSRNLQKSLLALNSIEAKL